MTLSYCQLDLDERRRIDLMHQRRMPVAEIARSVGRHRSTIYRELNRRGRNDLTSPTETV